jgi:hypothetical protein
MPKLAPWQQEFEWAAAICAPLGCTVTRSEAQFEIAKVSGEGIALIIYPHRTSAGNYHARVRDQNSKDAAKARRVMIALDEGDGLPGKDADRVRFSCTFSHKTLPPLSAGKSQ